MSRGVFYTIVLLIILIDQAVKAWVRHAVPLEESIPIWPGVFQITYTQNRGMAFSLLQGKTPLLAIAAFVVIAVIVVAQRRAGARMPVLYGLALALPLGGAVGNLIDRLYFQYVTDLFDFRLINFPVFNVADSAITIGIALLAWRTLMSRPAEDDTAAAPPTDTTVRDAAEKPAPG